MSAGPLVHDKRTACDASRVGAKAANLSRLHAAGLPVPAFVALPIEAYSEADGESASDALWVALEPHLSHLTNGGHRLAVRSSSPEEDGEAGSFAGLLESVLDVQRDAVAGAVQRVWQSAFSPRVMAYRRERGITAAPPAPGVIVQRMLEPAVSGVAFGADPVSGSRDVCIIAAVEGPALPLVDGSVDGQTWRLALTDDAIESAPDNGEPPLLSDEQVRQIRALCVRAGELFGQPQDIEWAIENDILWLVQSRPITTLAAGGHSDGPRRVWDNANISESYGGITTPLTFTFARTAYAGVYRAFCQLMGVSPRRVAANEDLFNQMLGLFRGRVYYNLYNWYRLIAMLPGYQSNRRFMEQMMGVREPMPDEVLSDIPAVTWRGRLWDRLDFGRSVVSLLARYAQLGGMTRRFETRVNEALALPGPGPGAGLEAMRLDELVAHYRELQRQLLTRWDAPLVNDFYTMICFGLLRSRAERWVGSDGWALVSRQLSGAEGMVSVEPARLIEAMGHFAAHIDGAARILQDADATAVAQLLHEHAGLREMVSAYIDRFGDRCMEELKLETATLRENPRPLWRAIGLAATRAQVTEADATRAREDDRRATDDAWRSVMKGKPVKRLILGRLMRRARRHLVLRENLRFERTRVFGRVRQIMVQIGQRLTAAGALREAGDVFYLEIDEVLGYVEGNLACDDLHSIARVRRAAFDRYRTLPAPPERFETRGAASLIDATGFTAATRPTSGGASGGVDAMLRGVGCYPGVVRGQVVCVRDPVNAPPIEGMILVAERTDPGWVMLFPGAAGVLVQRGSVLSHSATLARELRIPTIVALPGLMQSLADGDWIEMDGAAGTVRRLTVQADAEAPTSRRSAG